MLTLSLSLALVANFIFMFPPYRNITTGRYVKNPNYDPPEAARLDAYKMQQYVSFTSEKIWRPGTLSFKPFTCLFCMAFWVALSVYAFNSLFGPNNMPYGTMFITPVLAVAFDRWFNSLGVKI